MATEVSQVLLVAVLAVPLVAAALAALLGPSGREVVRPVALAGTVLELALVVTLLLLYPALPEKDAATTFEPRVSVAWNVLALGGPAQDSQPPRLGPVQFFIGLDGLNLWLVALTALLMVPAVLVSWTAIDSRVGEYYAWLLVLETALIGVFLAFDIILFYIFFELTLVPLFFLIGIWGGPQRQYAARKFFVYTLAGSVLTLLGVLGLVTVLYKDRAIQELTFSIPRLVELVNGRLNDLAKDPVANAGELGRWRQIQFWVFVTLMAGFAVKVPLVPLHTWLPLAHVEAPTAGSVILAGVLLKVGAYGFLRLCLPLAPDAALSFGVPLVGALAVVGIIYGAFCALAQDDIKKLVAYSSVSHLGFCMLGLFSLNEAGLSGGLLQMLNHGLSTGALFLLVGMLYERYHTRKLADYGGMASRLKVLACFTVFICLTSIGLPGLNGFVGEVLVLMGTYDLDSASVSGPLLASLAATGVVLGAWYLLTMLRQVFFGPEKEPAHEGHGPVADLNLRELAALVPIAAACLWIGLHPRPILDTVKKEVRVVTGIADGAKGRARFEPAKQARADDGPGQPGAAGEAAP